MNNDDLMKINEAHKLMKQFVSEHANDVAGAIGALAPFMCSECGMSGLQETVGVVNAVFAAYALEVLHSHETAGEDLPPLCLPLDAVTMQNAIHDLSRLLGAMRKLGALFEVYKDAPAFRDSVAAYEKMYSE